MNTDNTRRVILEFDANSRQQNIILAHLKSLGIELHTHRTSDAINIVGSIVERWVALAKFVTELSKQS